MRKVDGMEKGESAAADVVFIEQWAFAFSTNKT